MGSLLLRRQKLDLARVALGLSDACELLRRRVRNRLELARRPVSLHQ